MKVIHFESGLGNQMFNYVEYLIACKTCKDVCVIENILYEIPECNEVISQWNGYELDKIFGIQCPNIRGEFSEGQWEQILKYVRDSGFWNNNWNYAPSIIEGFAQQGVFLENYCSSFGIDGEEGKIGKLKEYMRKNSISWYRCSFLLKKIRLNQALSTKSVQEKSFLKALQTNESVLCGQTLMYQKIGRNIELVEFEIRKAFVFPELEDGKNLNMKSLIDLHESVSIHARRGDFLSRNGILYKGGYFKRAVKYIKKNVKDPIFIFFCDPGSIEWCKENEEIFGLNFKKDTVHFVDWNKAESSFRDMQLMARCKHNIITSSSFGWWAAFLNENPKKITISPDVTINTTTHL